MKTITFLFVIILTFGLVNCSCNCDQEDIDLQVHLKYEYADEVNTFENILMKDLVQAGTADTTFSFTKEQKYQILQLANDVGFFEMPKTIESTVLYEQNPSPGEQLLRIKYEDWDHTVNWNVPLGKTELEQKIKKLSYFIINIVIDSPEYKALPKPEGGYL